jgi:hypothetical protein
MYTGFSSIAPPFPYPSSIQLLRLVFDTLVHGAVGMLRTRPSPVQCKPSHVAHTCRPLLLGRTTVYSSQEHSYITDGSQDSMKPNVPVCLSFGHLTAIEEEKEDGQTTTRQTRRGKRTMRHFTITRSLHQSSQMIMRLIGWDTR